MHHIRVLAPADDVYAFYDGRIAGYRFADRPNWVDGGALSLGIASYAIVGGTEAIVYDTHVSLEHGRYVRDFLKQRGFLKQTVVLSHWHLDHVAGTEAFEGCEVIASERTAELLARFKTAIEDGSHEGPPAINPLILPTTVYADRLGLTVGDTHLELIHTNIHSDDATVIWLPQRRLLLCGDTMEDTVTYVDDPQNFAQHLADLGRLRQLAANHILPNHGDADVIAAGGYSLDLISATEDYIRTLRRCRSEPSLCELSLRELIAEPLAAGAVHYFAPYEDVHRENVATVLAC